MSSTSPFGVLFVCLGNICRSPLAEVITFDIVAKRGLSDQIFVDSAGTSNYHAGSRPDPRSLAIARQYGLEITHRSRQLVRDDFEIFDLICVMDNQNLKDAIDIGAEGFAVGLGELDREPGGLDIKSNELVEKVKLFRSFDPYAPPGAEVPDPYYGESSSFQDVWDMCARASEGLIDSIAASR